MENIRIRQKRNGYEDESIIEKLRFEELPFNGKVEKKHHGEKIFQRLKKGRRCSPTFNSLYIHNMK